MMQVWVVDQIVFNDIGGYYQMFYVFGNYYQCGGQYGEDSKLFKVWSVESWQCELVCFGDWGGIDYVYYK